VVTRMRLYEIIAKRTAWVGALYYRTASIGSGAVTAGSLDCAAAQCSASIGVWCSNGAG
jgi:hypothetical protein